MILFYNPDQSVDSRTYINLLPFASTIRTDYNPIALYRSHGIHAPVHLGKSLLCFMYLSCAFWPLRRNKETAERQVFHGASIYALSRDKLYASQSYVAQLALSM